jgi:hypothetical protein
MMLSMLEGGGLKQRGLVTSEAGGCGEQETVCVELHSNQFKGRVGKVRQRSGVKA